MIKRSSVITFSLLALFSVVTFGQEQPKVDFAKKIAEATPPSLPQEPRAQRPSTDARDKNLKGKVKSIVESSSEPGKTAYTDSEDIFDLSGNYIKSIRYDEHYPDSVTVWGYIDGKRVSKTQGITYAAGEKPERDPPDLVVQLGNPSAPGDNRYNSRYDYRYDSQGRLIGEAAYGHSNDLFHITTYAYTGDQRDEKDHDSHGNLMSRTVVILDKDGNAIEERAYGREGISTIRFMTYEFDSQGNWIVQKTLEAKGKTARKLLWTTFRTITYYP